jgi:hypothetical protein
VPEHDNAWDEQAGLISAAHAAASWARARRAQWDTSPSPGPAVRHTDFASEFSFDLAADPTPAVLPGSLQVPPPPAAPALDHRPEVPAATAAAGRTLPSAGDAVPWLVRGGLAIAGVVGLVLGVRSLSSVMPAISSTSSRPAPTEAKPASRVVPPAQNVAPAAAAKGAAGTAAQRGVGSLHVVTNPAGASVLVDGKARGVTPVTVADLGVGRHDIVLQSDAGTVSRSVAIVANQTVDVEEAIFSGFVTVYAPFDLTITENGRVLRADERHQIMLPSGPHELRFTNRGLAYDVVRKLDVKPGEATNLQLTPEPSLLTVTATDAAEVWVDGARLGDTPLNGAPVALGSHEIVVKRASGGERRFSVTIGAKPFTLNVEF